MKTLYLIRHCSAVGQEENASLNKDWIKQSYELCSFLQSKWIEKIVSSPYKRAIDSIKPLSEATNVEIEIDDNLIEKVLSDKNMENWRDKLKESFLDLDIKYEWWESSNEAIKRSQLSIDNALNSKYSTIAIVTHWALMTLILKVFDNNIWFNEWNTLSNPDVYKIEVNKNKEDFYIEKLCIWD